MKKKLDEMSLETKSVLTEMEQLEVLGGDGGSSSKGSNKKCNNGYCDNVFCTNYDCNNVSCFNTGCIEKPLPPIEDPDW